MNATLRFTDVEVLADDNLGLYFDVDGNDPVEHLDFDALNLKEPLHESGETNSRWIYVQNESPIDLFLIEPCGEVRDWNDRRIGRINPHVEDLDGNNIGYVCDRPRVRLVPGELVKMRVDVHDLSDNLQGGHYDFTIVFGAVGSEEVEDTEGTLTFPTEEDHRGYIFAFFAFTAPPDDRAEDRDIYWNNVEIVGTMSGLGNFASIDDAPDVPPGGYDFGGYEVSAGEAFGVMIVRDGETSYAKLWVHDSYTPGGVLDLDWRYPVEPASP